MRPAWLFPTLLILCGPATSALPAAADTHVLLIAVDTYPNPKWRLSAPMRDAALLKRYLTATFAPLHLTERYNQQATHTGVVAALEQLQKVAPDDTVLIYYSGHGSYTPDLNQDEQGDALDETWVTYGARSGLPGLDDYDLIDDELNHYLSLIPTDNLILISDSCHSGSMGRAAAKSLEADPRPHPRGTEYVSGALPPGVQLSATSEGRNAYEDTFADASGLTVYSVFTRLLVDALDTLPPNATWQEALLHTKAALADLAATRFDIDQKPQIEGTPHLAIVPSPQAYIPTVDGRTVVLGELDGAWVISAGLATGIDKGSTFAAVHGPELHLEVVEAGPYQSLAVLQSGVPPTVGTLLGQTGVGLGTTLLRVAVVAAVPEDARAAVALERRLLSRFRRTMTRTTDPDEADWVFWVTRTADPPADPFTLPAARRTAPPAVFLTDSQKNLRIKGALFHGHAPTDDMLDQVALCLKRETFLRLADGTAGDDFRFQAHWLQRGAPKKKGGVQITSGSTVFGEYVPKGPHLPSGVVLAFTLTNLAAEPRYLYVLNLGPTGAAEVAFPNTRLHEDSALFKPGETRFLPAGARLFDEPGVESIRVISTTQPIDPLQLAAPGAEREGSRGGGAVSRDEAVWSTALYGYRITAP